MSDTIKIKEEREREWIWVPGKGATADIEHTIGGSTHPEFGAVFISHERDIPDTITGEDRERLTRFIQARRELAENEVRSSFDGDLYELRWHNGERRIRRLGRDREWGASTDFVCGEANERADAWFERNRPLASNERWIHGERFQFRLLGRELSARRDHPPGGHWYPLDRWSLEVQQAALEWEREQVATTATVFLKPTLRKKLWFDPDGHAWTFRRLSNGVVQYRSRFYKSWNTRPVWAPLKVALDEFAASFERPSRVEFEGTGAQLSWPKMDPSKRYRVTLEELPE